MKRKFTGALAALLVTGFQFNAATAAIDNDAAVVELRTSCVADGVALGNCFTDLPTLNAWVWNTRHPSAVAPLLIDIGPGTFTGQFACANSGYVSMRGAGQNATILEYGSFPIRADNCTNMSFSDLTVRNTQTLFGVWWFGGGKTVWENVHLDMIGYAWAEGAGTGCQWTPGEHYWIDSRITARPVSGGSITAYYATCDVSWFIGSEVAAIVDSSYTGPMSVQTVRAPGGEIHFYGSVIRSISESGTNIINQSAVFGRDGGQVHIHGTGIDVISADGNDIKALEVQTGAGIHANQASYVMKTGSGGSKSRIVNNGGTVRAPYLWEEGTPPDISSANGADMVVTTDNADNQPHLVLYSDNCPGKWFDTVTGACR